MYRTIQCMAAGVAILAAAILAIVKAADAQTWPPRPTQQSQDRPLPSRPQPPAADLSECVNGGSDAQRLAACDRVIAGNPKNPVVLVPAHWARAQLRQKLGQWNRVVGDCDEILLLAPQGETRARADSLRREALAIIRQSLPSVAGRSPEANVPVATAAPPPAPPAAPPRPPAQQPQPQTPPAIPANAAVPRPPPNGAVDKGPAAASGRADLAECMNGAATDVAGRIDACTRAIAANPGNSTLPAHMQRAMLYQALGQWDRVIADCDEVVRFAAAGSMKTAAQKLRSLAVERKPAVAQTTAKEQWPQLNTRVLDALKNGDYGDGTRKLAEAALAAARSGFGERARETLASLANLALVHSRQGHDDAAEPLFAQVLQAQRATLGNRDPETLTAIDNLAQVLRREGRNRDAEPLLAEALKTSREVRGPRDPATLLLMNNLGDLYRKQSRFDDAEPLLKEALQTEREVQGERHPDTLTSLNNLAALYIDQDRRPEAEPLLQQALQTSRDALGNRDPGTLTSINNLAALYQAEGRLGDAETLFLEALDIDRQVLGPRHSDTLRAMTHLADLYVDEDRRDDAEPLFKEVLQADRELKGRSHPDTLTSLDNLAGLYDGEGRNRDAEPLYRELVQTSREALGPRHPRALQYRLNFVASLASQDRNDEAVRLLTEMAPEVTGGIGQEVTAAGVVRRRPASAQAVFQDMVLTLATADDASVDARRLAAATLLQLKVRHGEDEAWLARLARRSQNPRIRALVDDIGRLGDMLAAAADDGRPEGFASALRELEARQQELLTLSPEYDSRLRVLSGGLDDVRSKLTAGSVLIAFRQFRPFDFRTRTQGEPRFAAAVVTGAGDAAVADLGAVWELQPLAAALGAGAQASATARGLAAADPDRGLGPAAPRQSDPRAAEFYRRLTAPFADAVAAANRVYLAPDGILDLVPFARLQLPDGRYWFEVAELRIVQTGRDLLRAGADQAARGLVALGGIDFDAGAAAAQEDDKVFFAAAGSDRNAAVGRTAASFRGGFPPLLATAAEAKEVMAAYQKRFAGEAAELWSGADATKARLMALKSPPRVLHLATHGFYLPNQPREPMLLSGIALAGANREVTGGAAADGLLFALEAEGLNLDGTELVVLSACDAAKGDVDYSEGVFGLARALRTAGARNVLLTLWPRDDALARDFMADFYKNWLADANGDPAKALRDTELQWIKDARTSDPGAWAPYVVIE